MVPAFQGSKDLVAFEGFALQCKPNIADIKVACSTSLLVFSTKRSEQGDSGKDCRPPALEPPGTLNGITKKTESQRHQSIHYFAIASSVHNPSPQISILSAPSLQWPRRLKKRHHQLNSSFFKKMVRMQIQYVLTPYFYVVQFQPPVVATALKNHTLQQHCILEDFGGADKVSLTNV
jgi:hypothetical protein